ncbi:MAG TPA: LacI family DNA-binding transcriptional regulator [Trebonia sp.]|nr:LacI family DNA-binding transcriptional regulator [Trebonia sp.]
MDAQRGPTLRDVARLAGVHPSTASRCLDAAQSARIGASTRERVLAAARELGYQLNPAASSLRSRRTMTVGVLIPDFTNPIFGSLLTGINDRLEDSGYTAVIFETKDDERRMARALDVMKERRVDAVINTAAREQDQRPLARFLRHGIPMVLASRDLPALDVPKILSDDFTGATLAAQHLVELGHRRIAQLSGPQVIAAFVQRSRGFSFALGPPGTGASLLEHTAGSPSVDEGRRAMLAALRADEGLTGVFAHNDLLAIGAIAAIRQAGLSCPGDVSVVGYGATPLTEYLDPSLTTVLYPAIQMGRSAADTVLSVLRGDEPPSAVALRPRLVVRASTAPACART